MPRNAVITGSSGAIGNALVRRFQAGGYQVCGLDRRPPADTRPDHFIQVDLEQFVLDAQVQDAALHEVRTWAQPEPIDVLINNAAYQFTSTQHPMPADELIRSHVINVVAPYLLVTHLLDAFTPALASVINIGSVHHRLTKPGFVAYASSKAALASMTRGLAIDLGSQLRINCIEPAAVDTPMLQAGFVGQPEKLADLKAHHPQNRIATPEEIAGLAFLMCAPEVRFLHGACIDISGGISGRLHDPV